MTDDAKDFTNESMIRDMWRDMGHIGQSVARIGSQTEMVAEMVKEIKLDLKAQARDIADTRTAIQSLDGRVKAVEELAHFSPEEKAILKDRLETFHGRLAALEHTEKHPDADHYLQRDEIALWRKANGSRQWFRRNVVQIGSSVVVAMAAIAGFIINFLHVH